MKCKLFLLLCFLGVAFVMETDASQRKKKKATDETTEVKESAYDKLFKKEHVVAKGLITLHRMDNKLYFELPLKLLNKDMLLGSTITEISDNGDGLVGQKPTEPLHIQFTQVDSNIQIRQIFRYSITRKEDVNIERALEKANIGAIIGAYKIEAWNPDSTAAVIDVTDFFVSDNKAIEPIDPYGANVYGGMLTRNVTFKSDKSFLGEVKAFEDNVIVRSHLSYECTIPYGQYYVEYEKPLTVVATRSIILLPEEPARPRIADPRVGIFPTGKIKYTNTDNRVTAQYYANRWRLEPSDEAAYRAGKLVEPKKPIVFYIDNNFPEPWVKYVYAGVEDWNEAFEAIGFKNAIQARPFPTDDPEFDPDNIKYSCVRYAPTWMANSMGPSWTDPRTGEIINASVYTYHNIVSILYSWKFLQTAAADPDVRVKNFSEEIMGEAIQYVIAHEIGHCLGFMHNMGASSAMPVEKLRDPEFTQKYGITPTIMDYARFNYVAQPGDKERGVRLRPLDLGVYDYFLVKWNYSPLLDAKTPEDEEKILNQWVAEKAGDPMYRYGKQQIYMLLDPSALTEDLGDDAMKAAAYGIENLKYILPNLNTWFNDVDKDYTHRASLYNELIQQYVRYVNHVFVNIGGIYLTERYVGDPLPSYQSVPKEKQMRAVQFLMDQVRDLDWLEDKELVQNLPLMGSPASDIQTEIIDKIMASASKLALSASKSDDPYTPEECLNDVYDFVWAKTLKGGKTDEIDRKLQNAFVKSLINKSETSGNNGMVILGITDQFPMIEAPKYVNQTSIKNFGTNEWNSQEQVNGDVNGFEFLAAVNYATSPSIAHIYYGLLLKTKALLEKNVNHASMETRNHYRLLLHQIEKALK